MEKSNRTVVITGASSGAGRAIALAFAQNGDQLVLASRNESALNEVGEECREMKVEVKCIVTDVSNYREVLNLANEASEFGTGIDVWINNAGILAIGEFDKTPMEVTEQLLRTNLLGYMHGAHAALPYFKKQGRGILINNISIGGFLPVPLGVGYSASKFGLRGFSAALKAELVNFPNIHVCDAFPGFLDTPGMQHAANYTGKALKPGPIVYDPVRLALDIVGLSVKPSSEKMVGSFSVLMRYASAIFPGITRGIAGGIIKAYLKQANPMNASSGNIFNPVPYGNAVHGGWGIPGKPKVHRKYIAAGMLLIAASVILKTIKNKR